MTKEDQTYVEARSNHAPDDTKSDKLERETAAKAVLDNMARLRALRLAREAAEPARPAKTSRGTSRKAAAAKPKKSAAKAPALAAWLADQQNGGHRT